MLTLFAVSVFAAWVARLSLSILRPRAVNQYRTYRVHDWRTGRVVPLVNDPEDTRVVTRVLWARHHMKALEIREAMQNASR